MSETNTGSRRDSWIIDLIQYLVEREYDSAAKRVKAIYARNPGIDSDIAANLTIKDAAFWAAVVGVGVGAIEAIPAVGTAISAGALLPEVAYLTKLQVSVVLQIGLVYDRNLDQDELFWLVLTCLVYSYAFDALKAAGVGAAIALTRYSIERIVQATATTLGEHLANAIALKAAQQGVLKAVPFVAVPIHALTNYSGLQVLGHLAKKYFSPSYTRCHSCGSIQANCARFCSQCGDLMDRRYPPPEDGTILPVPV